MFFKLIHCGLSLSSICVCVCVCDQVFGGLRVLWDYLVIGVPEVVPVPVGLQDQKDLLDRQDLRVRRDESQPALRTLPPHRAPQETLAFLVKLEKSAPREASARRDSKVRNQRWTRTVTQ